MAGEQSLRLDAIPALEVGCSGGGLSIVLCYEQRHILRFADPVSLTVKWHVGTMQHIAERRKTCLILLDKLSILNISLYPPCFVFLQSTWQPAVAILIPDPFTMRSALHRHQHSYPHAPSIVGVERRIPSIDRGRPNERHGTRA